MKHAVVIVGGGTAGITVAARLLRARPDLDVAIIEPSEKHYYQPIWTLVGAGAVPREASVRDEAEVMPPGATWIHNAVSSFEPEANAVVLSNGDRVEYDYLVVAAGIQLDWDAIPGLKESVGRDGVCSNYSYETVNSTWENLRSFKGGTAIFTQPNTPIKCGGAPQKIMYLAADYFRRHGLDKKSRVVFGSASGGIFSVEKYANTLSKVIERYGIETHFLHNLVELRPDKHEAVFEHIETGERTTMTYDMIHVTPPQSAPNFIKQSPLADEAGWVDVDPFTLQHKRYANVFSLGDCSNLPTSKTGAAIRKQAPVLVENLQAVMDGAAPSARYDGYTSCPLVTGYGRLVLAEFDYEGKPKESFPFDQSQERYTMYVLKKYVLPEMYWAGMLKGLA
ncbi:MAG: NAD(P)/FAD-dependent oxidoreductase [Ardenticatenia bacterium]|nr:MAG: NAD(P)/FAD-dependent oxidoreductase [Ardenticatenia bacterium]